MDRGATAGRRYVVTAAGTLAVSSTINTAIILNLWRASWAKAWFMEPRGYTSVREGSCS